MYFSSDPVLLTANTEVELLLFVAVEPAASGQDKDKILDALKRILDGDK